uniref:receptor activity-modifying protein 3 n=1 Tax=Centroberyx gerrardi TaxID=166262 RepID=UPI003AAA8BAE
TSYEDELSELEEELGLPSNQTFNVITEDDESFQDQEHNHPHMHCLEEELVVHSHSLCGARFHEDMLTISVENWCDLDYVIRPYNDMTMCMESLSGIVGCYYPNPNVQDFFLHIHSQYFQNCPEEELLLSDAPHEVVVILTLIPVSLIPVLVFLVVWKSKVRE